jgi:3-deoxy-D-manno-octulosonic-acid transferase
MHDVEAYVSLASAAGFRVIRHTAASPDSEPYDVLVVDTFGSLVTLYAAADVAYIGSSLVPLNARRGGHHPLEPLVHGVTPLFGSSMNLWRAAVDRLRIAWPRIEVDSVETLCARAIDVIEGRAPIEKIRAAGDELIGESTGAVEKTVAFLRRELGPLSTQ